MSTDKHYNEQGSAENCQLCLNLNADRPAVWDAPLFETTNFVAIPSLGALVPGWMLIVPKLHVVATGALSGDLFGELHRFKEATAGRLAELYGPICAFEHGPSCVNRAVGCGVDHAHLHLVPISFDLRAAAQDFLPRGESWRSTDAQGCRRAFSRGEDYLYVEQPIGHGSMVSHSEIGSQLLRRAIASHLRAPEQFNWREHRQLDNVMSTVLRLSAAEPPKELIHS